MAISAEVSKMSRKVVKTLARAIGLNYTSAHEVGSNLKFINNRSYVHEMSSKATHMLWDPGLVKSNFIDLSTVKAHRSS